MADHAYLTDIITLPVSEELIGHVLAQDVEAVEAVPGYRASIVDGYAVRGKVSLSNIKTVLKSKSK